MTWSAVDFSQNFTLKKLAVQVSGNISGFLSVGVLLFGFWAAVVDVVDSFGFFFREFVGLLSAEGFGVVGLIKKMKKSEFVIKNRVFYYFFYLSVELSEWGSIDGDDGTFDQSFGSDQFVGGGVVDDIDNPGGSGDAFAGPAEVTVVQPQSSEFHVATHSSDGVHSFRRDFGVGSWSTEFELSLLVHLWFSTTGLSSFVP